MSSTRGPRPLLFLFATAFSLRSHENIQGVSAWATISPLTKKKGTSTRITLPRASSSVLLLAKKRTNSRDADDMSSWYDPVDEDATPDQVFFQEMERQRLMNQVGASGSITPSLDDIGAASSLPQQQQQNKPTTPSALRSSAASAAAPRFATRPPLGGSAVGDLGVPQAPNAIDAQPYRRRKVPTMEQIKIAEATLSEYEAFMVSDNWLNEELQEQMWDDGNDGSKNGDSKEESNGGTSESGEAGDGYSMETNGENGFRDDGKSEPWDDFGDDKRKDVDYERRNIMEVPFPSKGECHSENEEIAARNSVEQDESKFQDKLNLQFTVATHVHFLSCLS